MQYIVRTLKWVQSNKFKRKGNEKQVSTTPMVKLPRKVQEIPNLVSSTEEPKEGMKQLHTHKKLICLVNHSELDWVVVNIYESEELASVIKMLSK